MTNEDMRPRRAVMAVCADASAAELDEALARLSPVPAARDLRPVETGMVMLRGRAGGDGAPFNLGEATVTRAAVAVEDEATEIRGFAYHFGRDRLKARRAAMLDALWQAPGRRRAVEEALAAVRHRIEADRAIAARRTAATRVNFFTLARGAD